MNTPTTVNFTIRIPNEEGTAFVDQVTINVPAVIDADTGDTVLTPEAHLMITEARARRMGLLSPNELKALRSSLGLSQKEMAGYLQAGEKSYARWELGYGRQSRLVNNLLLLLKRGNINLSHLRRGSRPNWGWAADYSRRNVPTIGRVAVKQNLATQSGYSASKQYYSNEAIAA